MLQNFSNALNGTISFYMFRDLYGHFKSFSTVLSGYIKAVSGGYTFIKVNPKSAKGFHLLYFWNIFCNSPIWQGKGFHSLFFIIEGDVVIDLLQAILSIMDWGLNILPYNKQQKYIYLFPSNFRIVRKGQFVHF